MTDIIPVIETMENRWMRAWISRDARTLKALTSPSFRMVIGSKPCVILDAKSWLESAGDRYLCSSFRFGDIYARNHGSVAIFATQLSLKATIDNQDWSGEVWVTDLWRKSRVRRNWRMIERVVSRPETDGQIPTAVKALQRWR